MDPGETQRAAREVVQEIERRAGVEVVVVVRDASAAYLHVELACALAAMTVALGFVVFAPIDFSDLELVAVPVLAALFAGVVSWRQHGLRRALTPARVRRRAVEVAARAAFFDKTVGLTRRHTGILVYVSRLERDAAIVADQTVRAITGWSALAARIERDLGRARTAATLATALRGLAAPLAEALPRAAGEANELSDDVEAA